MIPGRATPEGTAAFAKKHADDWRTSMGLTHSSLGIGTYTGNADPVTDGRYTAAAVRAMELGVNVIDTAINYRHQRSERNMGAAMKEAIDKGIVTRDQIIVCTKGGFISGDMGPATQEWFDETYLKPGIIKVEDIVAKSHCMTPKYLDHEIEQSRQNLGLETIDVYYLHNPETQLSEIVADDFYPRLTEAFRTLEKAADDGKIGCYGVATWEAFRVPDADGAFMSMERVVQCAEEAGGKDHRLRVVQFPFNLALPEAYRAETQPKGTTALKAATDLGLTVFTSVVLAQGQLVGQFSPEFRDKFSGLKKDAQRCIQWARSTPGVAAPLCGMKDVEHVEENRRVAAVPPLTAEEVNSFFEGA